MEPEIKEKLEWFIKDMWETYDSILSLQIPCKHVKFLMERYPEFIRNKGKVYLTESFVDLDLAGLDGFKEILPVLEDLVDLGYECQGTRDEAASGYRVYDFGRIRVFAYLKTSSKRCFKVVIETKTDVRDIYKFVCLDEEGKVEEND